VTVCGLGPQVFLNCAGFIKIDTAAISDTTTNYIEVLDGSRVHPETYEWAKKMAVDALEYDEVMKLPLSLDYFVFNGWQFGSKRFFLVMCFKVVCRHCHTS